MSTALVQPGGRSQEHQYIVAHVVCVNEIHSIFFFFFLKDNKQLATCSDLQKKEESRILAVLAAIVSC